MDHDPDTPQVLDRLPRELSVVAASAVLHTWRRQCADAGLTLSQETAEDGALVLLATRQQP